MDEWLTFVNFFCFCSCFFVSMPFSTKNIIQFSNWDFVLN
jgi:hypothetical protein